MGMSTNVIGFRPPDQKWKDMKAVWDSCERANAEIPDEVYDFFNGEPPDEKGVEVAIPIEEWSNEAGSGFEVEISKLPKDVKIIRFYNSW